MHFDLKPISTEGIPEALSKVERYRLLNEPSLAESICQDILSVAPDHQPALIMLLLTRTDQFGAGVSPDAARELLPSLQSKYDRAYYEGIIWERLAHTQIRHARPGSHRAAYQFFIKAMKCYETAEPIRPQGNDDATLRWNTCARAIMGNKEIRPAPEDEFQPVLSE